MESNIVLADAHFGRVGHETVEGCERKIQAAKNLADFLRSRFSIEKPGLVFVGDTFHRPHWNNDVSRRNGEGFNFALNTHQIGALSEELRTGYSVTLCDGNCDPYSSMGGSTHPVSCAHASFLDLHEKIDIQFEGLTHREHDVFYTHGHLSENIRLCIFDLLGVHSLEHIQGMGEQLLQVHKNPSTMQQKIAEVDASGSSYIHHLVCQVLQKLEAIHLPLFKIRRIGNETIAFVIADVLSKIDANLGVFGHTHQCGRYRVNQEGGGIPKTVWNTGSLTGDLHRKNPRGTFLVVEKTAGVSRVTPYYSYHPDHPNEVIEMPEEHICALSAGERSSSMQ